MLDLENVKRLAEVAGRVGKLTYAASMKGGGRLNEVNISNGEMRQVAMVWGINRVETAMLMAAAPQLAETALYWMQQAQGYRDEALAWHGMVAQMQDDPLRAGAHLPPLPPLSCGHLPQITDLGEGKDLRRFGSGEETPKLFGGREAEVE